MIPPVVAGWAARIGIKGLVIAAVVLAVLGLAWRLQWLGAERDRLQVLLSAAEQRAATAVAGLEQAKAINARMTAALESQNQAIAAAQAELEKQQKLSAARVKAAGEQRELARKADLVLFGNPQAPSPAALNAALRDVVEGM